jgi:type IV pilus assembly protein PilQ
MSFVMLIVSATGAAGAPAEPAKADTAAVMQTGAGYLENITFEKFKGVERVTLMLSRQAGATTEDQGGRLLLVRLENLFVPQELRRVQGEGVLDNMVRVVPVQRTIRGIPQAVVTVELNKGVPYSVRQDGHNIVIDFNVAALPQTAAVAAAKPAGLAQQNYPSRESNPPLPPPVAKPATISAGRNGLINVTFRNEDIKSALQQIADQGGLRIIYGDDVKGTVSMDLQNVTVDQALDLMLAKQCLAKARTGDTINVYSLRKMIFDERDLNVLPHANRLISLEFQDNPIKGVFQVLAEHGDVNIVSGDDVKGNVTIHLRKIPWKLAFDTVIRTNGLVARLSCNNLITVMTLKKFRDEEKGLEDAEKARREAERARREEDQKLLEQQGRKKQITIEAKIIEATDEFVRKLGVQWGAGFKGNLNSSNPYSILAGANPMVTGTTFNAPIKGLAKGIALTTTDLAANFAVGGLVGAPSYALGFAIGGANAILDAQIMASEKTSEVRIISSPKVTTMDGSKAVIKQGEDVPVVTASTPTSPATVTFKEAVLKLEVKPTITADGKISMEVKANNDFPNYARAIGLEGNPPINKSEVESKVVVSDGDTLVVGGILKSQTDKGQQGLPWVSKVPILGWLFKYEDTTRTRKQLLIFITPRIVQDEQSTPVTDMKDALEKPKG